MNPATADTTATITKWAGILSMLGGAAYFFTQKDYTQAWTLFSAALAAAGFAVKLSAMKHVSEANAAKLDVVSSDVENIRENPAMPGTPIKPAERRERERSSNDF